MTKYTLNQSQSIRYNDLTQRCDADVLLIKLLNSMTVNLLNAPSNS